MRIDALFQEQRLIQPQPTGLTHPTYYQVSYEGPERVTLAIQVTAQIPLLPLQSGIGYLRRAVREDLFAALQETGIAEWVKARSIGWDLPHTGGWEPLGYGNSVRINFGLRAATSAGITGLEVQAIVTRETRSVTLSLVTLHKGSAIEDALRAEHGQPLLSAGELPAWARLDRDGLELLLNASLETLADRLLPVLQESIDPRPWRLWGPVGVIRAVPPDRLLHWLDLGQRREDIETAQGIDLPFFWDLDLRNIPERHAIVERWMEKTLLDLNLPTEG